MDTLNETDSDFVLLACATPGETGTLPDVFENRRENVVAGKSVVEGWLGGIFCRLVVTGIGVANTAHAVTCQLERSRPRFVLQFGIGGAYVPAGIGIGEVVCATEEIYGDLGVLTPDGWKPMDEIGIPLVPGDPPRFNRFPLEAGRVADAAEVLGVRTGAFVTVSQCSGVRAVGEALYHRFHALCENMEGAAAAQICTLYQVPFLELRAISNLIEDRDRSRWRIPEAIHAAQSAVEQFFTAIRLKSER